jgi:hypothetical protein
MPYPRKPTGQKWLTCYICGFHWPKSQLRRDSYGPQRCPKCWDADGFSELKRDTLLHHEDMEENATIEEMII